MILYARQILCAKRHRCKEQAFALCAGTPLAPHLQDSDLRASHAEP